MQTVKLPKSLEQVLFTYRQSLVMLPYLSSQLTVNTHTAIYVDIRLQDICMRQIATWLSSERAIKKLPLPVNVQNCLKQYMA